MSVFALLPTGNLLPGSYQLQVDVHDRNMDRSMALFERLEIEADPRGSPEAEGSAPVRPLAQPGSWRH